MIIDMQVHFWESDRPDRPHLDLAEPNLAHPFGPEQMLPLMDDVGVDHVVIVPPGFMGANNQYTLECVQEHPKQFSVMGLVDISDGNITTIVRDWLDQPGMLGVRTHLHRRLRERWGSEEAGDRFWDACNEFEIPVAGFAAGDLGYLAGVLERWPNLRLIIDHFGLPQIDITRRRGVDLDQLEEVLRLNRFPNVMVKVSTLPVRSHQKYPFADMHEIAKRTFSAFGPRRMMWATDFTQSLARNGSMYREELIFWREALSAFLSQDDADWILGKSALAGITHIKLPGSKQRTILDESHRSITHGCRQPSNQAHKTISRRGELAAPGSGGGFHHVCTPFKLLRARTSPLVASLHL